jgi:CrcB protein
MIDWLGLWANPVAALVGGGVGAWVRFEIGRRVAEFHAILTFPWHTFGINVCGSFLLGLLFVWIKNHPQPFWWVLLGTGFCGGFTTFSTFSVETLTMLEKGRLWLAAVYAGGSVAAGLLGALAAVRLARGV